MGEFVKIFSVFTVDANHYSQRLQCFSVSLGDVFNDVIGKVGSGKPGLSTVGDGVVGLTATGARCHAEGCVALNAIGS